ncbi:MAG: hypothetical protein UH854_00190 [Clostridia bacterium]|nr:hypothetical protein [Clostridia bacterium]
MKANEIVKKETIYIGYFCTILSIVMQVIFILCKKWDYTVILGNLLSLILSVSNFYFMGITVQKAVLKEEADAKKMMKSSSSVRTALLFVGVAIGVSLPVFNTIAVLVAVFFPRIAIFFRPLIKDKKEVINR